MVRFIKKYPIFTATFVFALFALIFFNTIVQPVLYFHELQPPFFKSYSFFQSYTNYPGGITEYASQFLAQFFYFGWPGAIVVSLLGSIMVILGVQINKKIGAGQYSGLLWLIVFALFIVQFTDYHFPLAIGLKMIVTMAFFLIFISTENKKLAASLLFIIIALLYYLTESGYVFVFAIMAFIYSFTKWDYKKALILAFSAVLYSFIWIKCCYLYVFNISPENLWFRFVPLATLDLILEPGKVFYLFIFSVPFLVLFSYLIKRLQFEKKIIPTLAFLAIVLLGTYFSLKNFQDQHRKNIIKADYYCYKQNWEKVIDVALKDPVYDVKINTCFNIALDFTDQLFDRFFDYPQLLGPGILYPDVVNISSMAMLSSDFYYNLGYLSESLHWAHEAQTSQPYNIRILKKLVQVNLAEGNYKAAEMYLNILKDNILCADFVNHYQEYLKDTTLISSDTDISLKRAYSPKGKIVGNISQKLNDLVSRDSTNKRAVEYLGLFHLLDHNMAGFLKFYPKLKPYFYTTPTIVDQSLAIYNYQSNSSNNFNVSPEAQNQLKGFLNLLRTFQNNREIAKSTIAAEYKNTYMFYLMYDSPRVTKINYTAEQESKYYR